MHWSPLSCSVDLPPNHIASHVDEQMLTIVRHSYRSFIVTPQQETRVLANKWVVRLIV